MEERKIFSWKYVTVLEEGSGITAPHQWSNELDDTYIVLSFDSAWLEVVIEKIPGHSRRTELLIPVARIRSIKIEHE